ncbi:glycosyltransferase [Chthonobacter albigriseus]|uniref:glycosyltransferase n=1 Tax=Chthonobacter albigriseus TaxID=1683161 RepID=UPI0015EE69F0
MPTISVAMATFNGARFIDEQLDSLARQTLPPDELVVSDDGSTDDTLAIVQAFAARAAFPVRVVHNERRLGFADNFLGAFARCSGDVIALCDQDDVWLPHKLERLNAAFADPAVAGVVHAATVVDASLHPLPGRRLGPTDDARYSPLARDPFDIDFGFSTAIRRTVLTLIDPARRPGDLFPEYNVMAHDQWTRFLADAFGFTVAIAEPLALYRQHGSNVVGAPAAGAAAIEALRNSAAAGADRYDWLRRIAADRSRVLAQAGPFADAVLEGRRLKAARRYARLAANLHRRAALYRSQALHERMAGVARQVVMGGYTGRITGGLGLKALAKDTAFAVGLIGSASAPLRSPVDAAE